MEKIRSKKALIIDANSLLHRAWHALPPMTAPDGTIVNAVYGFASVLLKILEQEHPSSVAVCWDTPEPTYRHEAREEYKAQREKQPDEFYAQIDLAQEIVEALGGVNVAVPGYEADDLLATFAKSFTKKKIRTVLLTSDRDVFQCITSFAYVMAFKKGVSETVMYDRDALVAAVGLIPEQIPDYKAMAGDPSDNLKGIPGIGHKTATQLLHSFGSLEGVMTAARDPKSDLTPALRKKLLDGEDEARALLPIVALNADVPLPTNMRDVTRRPVDENALRELFTRFGFRSLAARVFGKEDVKKTATPVRKDRGVRMPHVVSPTANEILQFFNAVKKEKRLIIHPIETPQESLFGDAPAAALGSANISMALREQDLSGGVKTVFAAILEDERIAKIGHGLKRAWHWAADRGFALRGIAFDTEIASYLAAGAEGRHDLDACAASHVEVFFTNAADRPMQEVDAIRALHLLLEGRLKEHGTDRVNREMEIPLIPILGRMEDAGVRIDLPYFKTLAVRFRKEKARLEREMQKLAGESFNPASPSQLAHVLFDALGIPTTGIKHGKTGISTAASELAKLEGAHPIIGKITEFREVAKLLSTYVDALPGLADAQGRVHTTYNQTVTATGRLSSTNPNLQNIPIRTELGREIRRGFVAEKGFVLLACDYSQIELRIVAALAKDANMLRAFQDGKDIHTATAAAILSKAEKDVTREERRAAKAINFGIVYGQGPQGLAKAAGISFGEAQEFIAHYFTVYSGVYEYLQATKARARDKGYVETLFGRRRTMTDINAPNRQARAAAERMAINMPVQGTAADVMKLAMISVAEKLPDVSPRSRMILQVHDELVFEVPEKDVTDVTKMAVRTMERAADIDVPLAVDAKSGTNWDQMTKA